MRDYSRSKVTRRIHELFVQALLPSRVEPDAVLVILRREANIHLLCRSRREAESRVLGLDRQLPLRTRYQHGQTNPRRAPEVQDLAERRQHRPARHDHVIDQHDVAPPPRRRGWVVRPTFAEVAVSERSSR